MPQPARRTLADLHAMTGRVLGTWTQFTDPDVVDLLGAAGFDFSIIDCEHGAFGIETAAQLIRACEAAVIVPLVRVAPGDAQGAGRLLDAGAAGIVAAGIESSEAARCMVAAAAFAPAGQRGACPIVRATDHSLMPWRDFARHQRGVGVIALIESEAGVGACEAICATPGLAAIMIGPFDLSMTLGCDGDIQQPAVRSAIGRVIGAARAAGVPMWMPVFAAEQAQLQGQLAHWAASGVRHFVVGADKIIVSRALSAYLGWAADAQPAVTSAGPTPAAG